MGSKIYDLKEVKWSINSFKSKLDSVNDREANNDDGKYPDSSKKDGNHEKRQRLNNRNPALARKGGLTKEKTIDHNSA